MAPKDIESALQVDKKDLVSALANLPEDQWFERKSGRIAPRDLARPLIAFANAEGGTIVVGIHNGKLDSFTDEDENAFRQAAIDFTVPPVRANARRIDTSDGPLLILEVQPGPHLHTTQSGECYLRIGDESRKLTLTQQQELQYDRGTQTFEVTPTHLTIEDLDQEKLAEYTSLIGASGNPEMLHARDLIDRQGRLTVAATLLFAKRPQLEFPSAYVRVITYNKDERGLGTTMNLTDSIRIEGPIPEQIQKAVEAIEQRVPTVERLTASGLFKPVPIIPREAWIEGLVNAVIHRSYSNMGDHIRFEIFPHRIEISSPGRFPGLADPRTPLAITRYARNPRIARVCADMGITRELGEGIKRIFAEMQDRGLAEPIYHQTSASVRLILSAADVIDPKTLQKLSKTAREIIDIFRLQNQPLSTGEVAEAAGIARPTAKRALESLRDAGLVEWRGQSPNDPRASWHLL